MTLVVQLAAKCPRCGGDVVLPFGTTKLEVPPADVYLLRLTAARAIRSTCPRCGVPLIARPVENVVEVG